MVFRHAEALIPLAEENPAFTSYATIYGGRALLRAGRIEEAKDSLRRGIKFSHSTGLMLFRAGELLSEAECCAIEGNIGNALALLADALREAEEFAYWKAPVMILRVDLLVREGGRRSEVEGAYRAALDCARDLDNRFAELEGTTHFSRWLRSQGRQVGRTIDGVASVAYDLQNTHMTVWCGYANAGKRFPTSISSRPRSI
jgi:tetratricopeptide (TPR) repeat protein